MEQITGERGKMWGDSIVGFGSYHYKYASGREGDMPITGFSPRKQDLTVYIMGGLEQYEELLEKLGKHRTGKVLPLPQAVERYRPGGAGGVGASVGRADERGDGITRLLVAYGTNSGSTAEQAQVVA